MKTLEKPSGKPPVELFVGTIGLDHRRTRHNPATHWRLAFCDQLGRGHEVFEKIRDYVKGPSRSHHVHWDFIVDDICNPPDASQKYVDMQFNDIVFNASDGIMIVKCLVSDQYWHETVEMMKVAFAPGIFQEANPTTITIDLSSLKFQHL